MRYDTVLFDLDGTLTDPGQGIKNSVRYALRKSGVPIPSEEVLDQFIGPPLYESFEKLCGMPQDASLQAVAYYREYFSAGGMFENEVIPGIPELLGALNDAGIRCIVATAKPEVFTVQILRHFELDQYFSFVAAATLDKSRAHKDEVIAYALENGGIPEGSSIVMVGDRDQDVNGAAANGLPCIGVLFGYGSREELESAGAIQIAGTPAMLGQYLLGEN
ncbi:MAG: HAD family hydrolase [Oscillospiraceae bacterium]|nr:HAD family hydrolase [Oscillospiraceae bacterium]